ncbi:hypothetical protein K504DRAFT_461089 [Pleomassaria siparia CBS 279.74]|uniref:Extracellular membrane protein CFEM domain-containing protein n=1 Tax=Pleomassaria siparia CBS 279.74 TaxID=1314801 RepID=A0A6G1JW51_9PLEO|nr:hypothetical protein K504DRAFT_461089 [Pleomassaria siparia CBS 279.74]
MMFGKATLFFAFAAVAKMAVAASTPPSCLLGAINTYSDPSDLKTICESKDVQSKISSACGDSTKAALSALAETCNSVNIKVSTNIVSGSASGTATSKATGTAASVSGSATSKATGSAAVTTGSAAVTTGAPTPTSTTGASAASAAAGKLEIGVAAVFAGFGFLAVAL